MMNSDRSRSKLTEQTISRVRINLVQHTQFSNMKSMTQRQESLIMTKPGHRIYLALEKMKMKFRRRPPHRRTILKDCQNKCTGSNEATQNCTQRQTSPTATYQFFERISVDFDTCVSGRHERTRLVVPSLVSAAFPCVRCLPLCPLPFPVSDAFPRIGRIISSQPLSVSRVGYFPEVGRSPSMMTISPLQDLRESMMQ